MIEEATNPPLSEPTPVVQSSPGPEDSRTETFVGKNRSLIMVFSTVLLLAIAATGVLYARSLQPVEYALPTPTPNQMPTPTPTPHVSKIATTSAFNSFQDELASFSATLNGFSLQDSTLAPPALDLELGL